VFTIRSGWKAISAVRPRFTVSISKKFGRSFLSLTPTSEPEGMRSSFSHEGLIQWGLRKLALAADPVRGWATVGRLYRVSRIFALQCWRLPVALSCALLILLPVLTRSGWPYNHDWLRPVARMATIAAHWRIGQLIPVWDTNGIFGYGSPSLAIYHKAFCYLSAVFYIVTSDAKFSLIASLACFMVIGFLGIASCVRVLRGASDPPLEIFAGMMLVSCNYASTDWLVRGDLAEFSAFMLASWLFGWCLRVLVEGRWPIWIGPLMGGLALAHSVIALYSLLLLLICVLLAFLRWTQRAWNWWRPLSLSVLCCLCITLPFVLTTLALSSYPRWDFLLVPGYTPRTSHTPLLRLVWDRQWKWGGQIGPASLPR